MSTCIIQIAAWEFKLGLLFLFKKETKLKLVFNQFILNHVTFQETHDNVIFF